MHKRVFSMTFCLLQAGKFDTIPTLINLVAAFTSVGLVRFSVLDKGDEKGHFNCRFQQPLLCRPRLQGTVLCDVILLNFLKGAEQYKAKKFEEVTT